MAISLGIIPSWQFSQDPAVNYNLNPTMAFPVGMNQLTVQPINNVVPSGDRNLQGRRSWFSPRSTSFTCAPGCTPLSNGTCDCSTMRTGVRGLGITMAQYIQPGAGVKGLAVFDSWWWNNRKWLAFGALGILGLAVAGVATKVLR